MSAPTAHIRGVIASASLKRFIFGCHRSGLSGYPRRYRLGLIEAIRAALVDEIMEEYPRRYRLGLIEAL